MHHLDNLSGQVSSDANIAEKAQDVAEKTGYIYAASVHFSRANVYLVGDYDSMTGVVAH
jgi:hypothetical protein